MKVEFAHVAWLSTGKPYIATKVVTNDGTTMEIKDNISEELVAELERQILSSAREKFMIAAKESNFLTASVVVEADDCPF